VSGRPLSLMEALGAARGSREWLLLIHQIPPKPDYFRVKVRRRLDRLGSVALKNSVYVLP
jgi:DNA-binding transcriptional regulator PaaX